MSFGSGKRTFQVIDAQSGEPACGQYLRVRQALSTIHFGSSSIPVSAQLDANGSYTQAFPFVHSFAYVGPSRDGNEEAQILIGSKILRTGGEMRMISTHHDQQVGFTNSNYILRITKGEQGGAANRNQPIRSETNQTSSAAGSDR